GVAAEARSRPQVLRRIAGDGELGEEDEIGALWLRGFEPFENQLPVAVQIADDGVDLHEGEPHTLSLAVFATMSRKLRPALAAPELHDPQGDPFVAEDAALLDGDPEVAPARGQEVRTVRWGAEPCRQGLERRPEVFLPPREVLAERSCGEIAGPAKRGHEGHAARRVREAAAPDGIRLQQRGAVQ